MSGTVVDTSGQTIPGADILIVNESTGEQRSGTSNEVGDFIFPALAPGPYTIRVTMSGFKPREVKGAVVLANNRLAVGQMPLELGELTEVITVASRGEALATSTTSHQAVLDVKQVQNLSIRGRDPISLLKILPGVAQLPNDQETFGGSYSTPVPNIQGGRGQTIYVDGINGGDGGGGANFSGATNVDAIAEVNVQMSAYAAEYGLKGGAQVNIVTKSGGAEYHGTGYWYKRHEMWNATNFFNNRDGIAKPQYRYSTLGGTLGGPIPKVPKVNGDGKKLFFFYAIDDTQLKDVNRLRYYTVPTALERQGDFSQTRTPSGQLIQIRDPNTGLPFDGNRIPTERGNPAALALMNLIPLPNASGVGYNYVMQEPSIDHPRRQHVIKVNYHPTTSDSLAVKYQTWYTKSVGWAVAGGSSPWGLVRQRYDFTADQGKIDYTRILNARTVLEVSTGIFYSTEDGPPEDDRALAGIQRSTYPALANLPQFAAIHNPLDLIPKVQFGALQNNSQEVPNIAYDNRWPIYGADTALAGVINLTHTRGAHTFKTGVMVEHERFGQARSGTFGGEFSFANDPANPLNTGFAYANAFLGQVTTYTESMGRVGDNRRQTTVAWYAQDTWKVTPKITLDLGVRMYKWSPPLQGGGEASAFSFERFDPTWGGNPPVLFRPVSTSAGRRAQNPLTGEILPVTYVGLIVPGTGFNCGVITSGNPCSINGIVTQDDPNYTSGGRGFMDPVPIQFDPRAGMAWVVTPKTVVRVAGGGFHDATGGVTYQGGPAWRNDRVIRYTDMNSFLSGGSATSPVGNVTGVAREGQRRPVTWRYTAAVQRELGWKTVLDVAFVGDETRNLPLTWDYNQIPAGARFRPENRDLTVTPTAANPGALPDVFLRPIVGYGAINITTSDGKSRYRSLQTQLTRRFTGGLELAGSYTLATGSINTRRIDGINDKVYQGNPFNANLTDTTSSVNSDPGGPDVNNARLYSGNLQRHVVVASYTWDIPNLSKLVNNSAVRLVFDNWRISGISTFASGYPANVSMSTTDNFDFAGGGEQCGPDVGSASTPGIVMNGDPTLPSSDRSAAAWFNTSVFARPSGRGDYGNCNNFKLTLPGWENHDLSFFKDITLHKNQRLQFRWEIYNLFNHTQFSEIDLSAQFDPQGNQTDTNFGRPLAARNERRMQMSIRYLF